MRLTTSEWRLAVGRIEDERVASSFSYGSPRRSSSANSGRNHSGCS